MALTQKEKDRIIEEEKARLEARRDFYKESYGGHCGHGSGCHCCGRGWGFGKFILAVIILYTVFHCWHNSNCVTNFCTWGSSNTTTTSAPVVPPAKPAVPSAKPAVPPAKPAAPPVTQ